MASSVPAPSADGDAPADIRIHLLEGSGSRSTIPPRLRPVIRADRSKRCGFLRERGVHGLLDLRNSSPVGEDVVKVVIADDHAVVRSGLRMLLDAEEGLQVVA